MILPKSDKSSLCSRISPEANLLCRCATTAPIAADITRIVEAGLNWDRFLTLAVRHKLLSLVYRSLSQAGGAVPQAALEKLRARFNRNTQINLRLLAELKRILAELNSSRVMAVPFKGLALAADAYGNLALREAGDIDLLV